MKKIILFRYHNDIDFCIDRLSYIKKLNPGVPVYGLFGGHENEFEIFDYSLSCFFEHNYCIKNKTGFWKWKNSDLVYRLWFKEYGHTLDFDSVVVSEWDLVMLEPIDKIYAHVKTGEVGMTGLTRLSRIEKKWFWTRDPDQRRNWLELLQYVTTNFGYSESPFASLCPGVILPKAFLEDFNKIDVPELSHDELRLPLFAQVLGYPLVDLGFFKKWFSPREWQYFNCNEINISMEIIQDEFSKPDGRRVFHPFRDPIGENFPKIKKEQSVAG